MWVLPVYIASLAAGNAGRKGALSVGDNLQRGFTEHLPIVFDGSLGPWNVTCGKVLVFRRSYRACRTVSCRPDPPSMNWWWGFLAIANALTLLSLLTPLCTGGWRSIYDLLAGTCIIGDWTEKLPISF